jgi:hypothetical protein
MIHMCTGQVLETLVWRPSVILEGRPRDGGVRVPAERPLVCCWRSLRALQTRVSEGRQSPSISSHCWHGMTGSACTQSRGTLNISAWPSLPGTWSAVVSWLFDATSKALRDP